METSTSGELTEFLQAQMLKYQTSQLVGVRPDEFRKDIEAFLHMNDADMEEFIDPKKQRDLSIKFHWGHNHDFGDFRLEGRMQNRHIELLANFINDSGCRPPTSRERRCWTLAAGPAEPASCFVP